ncbi:MAG: hypothetical protein JNK75_09295 [Betaproteobacteria bacterium]|nr:hypothetical protein [Betaproteobacteria bacterium]
MTATKWYWYLWPFIATDVWQFEHAGETFILTNRWFGPTRLLRGAREIARATKMISTGDRVPILTAKVETSEMAPAEIRVFIESIWYSRARIEINGERNPEGLV